MVQVGRRTLRTRYGVRGRDKNPTQGMKKGNFQECYGGIPGDSVIDVAGSSSRFGERARGGRLARHVRRAASSHAAPI